VLLHAGDTCGHQIDGVHLGTGAQDTVHQAPAYEPGRACDENAGSLEKPGAIRR
jgi:hypothetical protein